ncbi:MAG: calcium-translocating P-type ATPase, PMCA-type [Lentisphaeria bacterium]
MKSTNLNLRQLGLKPDEVQRAREKYGRNLLTPPSRPSVLKLYLEKFKDPIIRILLFAALLSLGIGFFEGEFVETIGILIAIFLATSIGFYFEYDAQKRFDVLNALGQEELITVVRDGQVTQVPRSELVVDDIVILEQGVEIPADGILLESVNLDVNESSLTGEPLCHKTVNEKQFDAEATYPSNKVLRSSMVVDGHGVMRVEAVGDRTEVGQAYEGSAKKQTIDTPLNQQLNRLSKMISRVALAISLVVFIICTIHGLTSYFSELLPGENVNWLKVTELMLNYFMMAVTLMVMAVPEGLPMAVTLSLALNMRRMLKTNNLVRKMHACETMGAITVICTDKTGTLTQNRMEVTDIKFKPVDENLLRENISVNSTAHLMEEDGLQGIGNPTECALLLYLKNEGVDYIQLRRDTPIVNQLSFSSERKYMATLVESRVTGSRMLYVKGAPEVVMRFCQFEDGMKDSTNKLLKSYQQAAMRTLAFACREVRIDEKAECRSLVKEGGFQFLGICSIMDPVRSEVPAAIATCREAGIKVKIVTGDTAGTAIEIARRIGLWTSSDTTENAITGPDFGALNDEEAALRVKNIKVMSRARPMDKQRFVDLLQKQGEVVAVTGDGTNDAPALNMAQVGLSMGSGTSVAKEASDITLIDDSFRSIATAVMWGRSLYRNIQRFVAFQLTISLTALAITVVGSFFDTDLPLTVTQILWINLIVDTFASLALSTIPPSLDVMKEKPRKASDFIITPHLRKNILGTAFVFFIVLVGMLAYFNRWGQSSINISELTVFFTFFVMLQFWNLLNARTLGSHQSAFQNLKHCRGLLLVMFLILVGQILIVQLGGAVFRTEPMSIGTWGVVIAISSFTLWIGELVRFIQRKRKRHE